MSNKILYSILHLYKTIRMSSIHPIDQIIRKRRSIFPGSFIEGEIPVGTIETLIENANWAPTHRKTQPWRFKIVRGEGLKRLGEYMGRYYKENTNPEKYSDIKYNKTIRKPMQSSFVIIICMKRDQEERVPEWEEIASVAMAVQNIWLSCADRNIGTYWSSPKSMTEGNFIELEEGMRCLGLMYMGKIEENVFMSERDNISTKIEWINE